MVAKASMLYHETDDPRADEKLLKSLISCFVAGNRAHHDSCTQHALAIINSREWQDIFVNPTFFHTIRLAHELRSSTEVGFSLYCQALELIYFCIANHHDSFDERASFDRKFKVVFKYVYGWKAPTDSADAIRYLRNEVMHTGSIRGVKQNERLSAYFKKFDIKDFENIPNIHQRTRLVADFEYLMNDILMRIIGLRLDPHLNQNGSPAWRRPYFGYEQSKSSNAQL